jgi:hypothetical protein
MKLWSTKTTQKNAVHTLPGHEDEVYALDWYYIYILITLRYLLLLILILIGVLLVSLSLLVVKIELLKYGEIRKI